MNFRLLSHVDVWPLVASLYDWRALFDACTLRQDTVGSFHSDTKAILLRGPRDPSPSNWFSLVEHFDTVHLGGWPAAQSALQSVKEIVRPATLGKAMIVSLRPSGCVGWHIDEGDYAERYHRLHLPLVTNPAAFLYSGHEQMHVESGLLVEFNNRVLHSAVNFGRTPRIHLIVDYA